MKKLAPAFKNLVKILNEGGSHSGNDLSHALSISRNAVWKHIQQLIKCGLPVESSHGQGYQLLSPLILLDEPAIRSAGDLPEALPIEIFASIPSTNDAVRDSPSPHPLQFCLAEHQSQGRGRFGRSWISPFGANIMLSAKWTIARDISTLAGFSLVVSLALRAALAEYGVPDLYIKWPNDIVYHSQKLAGILIEIKAESHGALDVIIGIGLNVNLPDSIQSEIDRPITSIRHILPGYHDRNRIAGLIIKNLATTIQTFDQHGFAYFRDEWALHDALLDQSIHLMNGDERIEAIARGVNESGHLVVQDQTGALRAFSAGEVSLQCTQPKPNTP